MHGTKLWLQLCQTEMILKGKMDMDWNSGIISSFLPCIFVIFRNNVALFFHIYNCTALYSKLPKVALESKMDSI